MKREQLLQKKDSQVEKEQVSFQLKEDKLQLEADLLETQRKVGQSEQKLLTLKSASRLSPSEIIAESDLLEGYKAGIKALESLKKELF